MDRRPTLRVHHVLDSGVRRSKRMGNQLVMPIVPDDVAIICRSRLLVTNTCSIVGRAPTSHGLYWQSLVVRWYLNIRPERRSLRPARLAERQLKDNGIIKAGLLAPRSQVWFSRLAEDYPTMLVLAPLISLVAAVAALQNPHRKAASFRQPADGLRKREVSASPAEHKYLNEKTQSKCGTLYL